MHPRAGFSKPPWDRPSKEPNWGQLAKPRPGQGHPQLNWLVRTGGNFPPNSPWGCTSALGVGKRKGGSPDLEEPPDTPAASSYPPCPPCPRPAPPPVADGPCARPSHLRTYTTRTNNTRTSAHQHAGTQRTCGTEKSVASNDKNAREPPRLFAARIAACRGHEDPAQLPRARHVSIRLPFPQGELHSAAYVRFRRQGLTHLTSAV